MTLVISRWDEVLQRHIPVRKTVPNGFDVGSHKKDIGEITAISYYPSLEEIWVWCDPAKVKP